MSKTRVLLFLSIVFCAVAAQAIVYIVPSDRELVNNSQAIVIGTAMTSHAELRANGSIVTIAELRIEQVLKGGVAGATIEIVELGGFLSDRASVFPGSPRYEDGARYLVLLEEWPDGAWRTSGWQLGQFAITTDLRGQRYLSRGGDEMIFGLDAR
ncbi:MAG TPA: hypothetical protein VJ853_14205, partial [Thermoanaerobaculia bacterium]|nr:hypothetical protein [Thermoanaerobaculia bacterium]